MRTLSCLIAFALGSLTIAAQNRITLNDSYIVFGTIPTLSSSDNQSDYHSIEIIGYTENDKEIPASYIYDPSVPKLISESEGTLEIARGLNTDIRFSFNEDITSLQIHGPDETIVQQLFKHLENELIYLQPKDLTTNPVHTCARKTTIAVDASSSVNEIERRSIYIALSALAQSNQGGLIDVVVFNNKVLFHGTLSDYLQSAPELNNQALQIKGYNTDWSSFSNQLEQSMPDHLIVITDNIPNISSNSDDAVSASFEVFNNLKAENIRITFIGADGISKKNAALALGLMTSLQNPVCSEQPSLDLSLIAYDYVVLKSFNELTALFTENELGSCNTSNTTSFKVHPNPARDYLIIETTAENWTAVIFDTHGKQRLVHDSVNGNQIPLSGLDAGHFEVKCMSLNEVLGIQKVIVIR